MKKVIRANRQEEKLVDLLAKTASGKWEVIFTQIPESQATEIWRAGFATGENRFSIETEEGKRVAELNKKALGSLAISSSTNYKVDVVPEANDDYDLPTTWSIEMTDSKGNKHYIWIVKYDEKEYVVEDSNGNNLAKGLTYTTFSGAKTKAFRIAARQEDRDFFTD